MKTATIIFFLTLIAGLNNPGISQTVILSTDKGKTCKAGIEIGQIKDNILDVLIKTTWISLDLKPVIDNQSVIGLVKEKITVNFPGFIRLINPTEGSIIASNSTVKLTYEVSEKFHGGEFIFKFPFFYAPSIEAAQDARLREEFTLKRPRDYVLSIAIQKNEVIDKYPPMITILSPEGVDDGLKYIVDTTMIKVRLLATDASGIGSVMVNHTLAVKDNDSVYTANISLKAGYENTIIATATDITGKVSKKQFPVECRQPEIKTIVIAPPQPPSTPKIILSDVDIDIPDVAVPDPLKFALIIGNEDYSSYQTDLSVESNVEFAVHDADVFREYVIKTVGVPEENIIFIKNAKTMEMHRALSKVSSVAKNSKGKAELYVYYAGHGFPDEQTREPYLIPVDVSGNDLQFAIKLNDFYKKLIEFPTKRATVFIDACFSGGGRDLGLIPARGVKIKPKDIILKGNIIVFTASSGEQSSLPYRDKQHGMFTYYLLKKLKETRGEVSLNELSEFLSTEIGIRSVLINNKEQNPQTIISPLLGETWKEWKIK